MDIVKRLPLDLQRYIYEMDGLYKRRHFKYVLEELKIKKLWDKINYFHKQKKRLIVEIQRHLTDNDIELILYVTILVNVLSKISKYEELLEKKMKNFIKGHDNIEKVLGKLYSINIYHHGNNMF